jgi:hypothetical protein
MKITGDARETIIQDKIRQDKTRQDKARLGKARQGKTRINLFWLVVLVLVLVYVVCNVCLWLRRSLVRISDEKNSDEKK